MVKNTKSYCPYNAKHRMRYTRLIYHLAKGCPDMSSSDFEICIYNWVHRVPKGSLDSHYETCEFKPQLPEAQWSSDVVMENWNCGEWNSFRYERTWPPEWFPDF